MENNTLKFLKEDVLQSPDRFKAANLTWEELGRPEFSSRFWNNLANTCENLFGFKDVAEYCRHKAEKTLNQSITINNPAIRQELADFLKKR